MQMRRMERVAVLIYPYIYLHFTFHVRTQKTHRYIRVYKTLTVIVSEQNVKKALSFNFKGLSTFAFLGAAIWGANSYAGIINEHPDILVCSVSENAQDSTWQDLVFYVSGTQKDGAILYKSLTSNPVLIRIDESGVLSAPKLANCDKKTVQALREAGRAKDFGK